jgi:hypothetical protein
MPGRQIPVECSTLLSSQTGCEGTSRGRHFYTRTPEVGSGYAESQPSTRSRTYEAPSADRGILTVVVKHGDMPPILEGFHGPSLERAVGLKGASGGYSKRSWPHCSSCVGGAVKARRSRSRGDAKGGLDGPVLNVGASPIMLFCQPACRLACPPGSSLRTAASQVPTSGRCSHWKPSTLLNLTFRQFWRPAGHERATTNGPWRSIRVTDGQPKWPLTSTYTKTPSCGQRARSASQAENASSILVARSGRSAGLSPASPSDRPAHDARPSITPYGNPTGCILPRLRPATVKSSW